VYKTAVSPLTDDDVDRIARRVAWKLIVYGLLILVGLWVAQFVLFGLLALLRSGANGSGLVALIPLGMSLLAVPAILLIWIWGRSRRSR
jgi:hypothetical protein